MPPHNFKIGDRVKYTGNYTPEHIGLEAVVEKIRAGSVWVRFNNKKSCRPDGTYGILFENLTPIEDYIDLSFIGLVD